VSAQRKFRVLFVCLGNICRSPTAEAVFRKLAASEAPDLSIEVESAGTAGYHIDEPPDPRSQEAAKRRGYDMSPLRARIVAPEDFNRFDLILAMDQSNFEALHHRAPPAARERVRLFLEFGSDAEVTEVPDPYYGGPVGFEHVLDLVEDASRELLKYLRTQSRAA